MKFNIDIKKKHFFAILGAVLILAGAFSAYAYSTSNPSYFGHTAGELYGLTASQITGIDDIKVKNAVYADNAGTATTCTTAGSVSWNGVTGKPSIDTNNYIHWENNQLLVDNTPIVSLSSSCIRIEGDAHADYFACGCSNGVTKSSKTAPGSVGKVCFVSDCDTLCP